MQEPRTMQELRETAREHQVIPPGLDEMEPGPFLAAILSTIDPDAVTGFDRVVVLKALQRMVSHFEGKFFATAGSVAEANAEAFDDDLAAGFEAAEGEVGAALRLTRRAANRVLELADGLRNRLPVIGDALTEGNIDTARARVIVNETAHLGVGTARDVADEVIGRAQKLTTGQLRALIRKLCIDVNPEEAADRYEEAVSDRCVVVTPNEMGTADLTILNGAPDKVIAATDRINYLAKQLRGQGETRSMDQLRADVALDLLIGNPVDAPTRRGVTDIHVDLETLARLSDAPGELGGYGPITADIARQIAGKSIDGEWRYTIHDPNTGQVVANGTTRKRRKPTTVQTRWVQARTNTCIAPGCRMPATQCDLDHLHDHTKGGPTTCHNLAPLCRHHHVQKHKYNWKIKKLPGHDHQFTSPLGHTHTTSGLPPPDN